MLSRNYPNKKAQIWTGAMGLALATGYFRLAADKHYMSDVITGAITGTLIGRFVQNKRSKTSRGFVSFAIGVVAFRQEILLSLIHISEPTRPY